MLEWIQQWANPIGLLALAGAVLLNCILMNRLRKLSTPNQDSQQDLTNRMILFQTMRDLVRSQKDLAQQLNESVDRKVGIIRKLMKQASAEQQGLRQAQEELANQLRAAREELAAIQKQLSQPATTPQTPVPSEPVAPVPSAMAVEVPEPAPKSERLLAVPDAAPEDDLVDNWVGLDFGGDEPKPNRYEVPASPPQKPEDPEAARDAFRKLLNFEPASTPERAERPTNGRNKPRVTPLQARVYEYADAGMSTAQIARELGIGKGEVRLIIGLRKDRQRHG